MKKIIIRFLEKAILFLRPKVTIYPFPPKVIQRKPKLRKKEIEKRIRESIESNGGKFIKINWAKSSVHFLSPSRQYHVEYVHLKF